MTMQQERRLSERKTLEQLAYIKLPSGSGGIVRDVSGGGLSFRTVAPVEPCGPIEFWFTGERVWIWFSGELVWTDDTKKTGGLRFTHLSEDAREQIRSWSNESNRRLGTRKDSAVRPQSVEELPDVPALDESPPSITNETSTGPALTSDAFHRPGILRPERYAYPLWSSKKPYFEEQSRSPVKAICISVLAIIIAVLSSIYLREAGEWSIWLGTRTHRESRSHAVAPSPAPNLSFEAAPVGDAPAEKSRMEGVPTQAAPHSSSTATPGTTDTNAARPLAPQAPTADAPLREPLLPRGAIIVQVAAFTQEANARKLVESLRQKNIPAFLSITSTDGVFYRVQVGPYANEESALTARGELGRAGFKPFIRH